MVTLHKVEITIGNPNGKIALTLDKEDAIELAHKLDVFDLEREELLSAVKKVYGD